MYATIKKNIYTYIYIYIHFKLGFEIRAPYCNVGRETTDLESKCKALFTNVVKTGRVEHQQTVYYKAEAK